MIQYKRDDKVSLSYKVNKQPVHITEEIFSVIKVDKELQCLVIYGTTQNGDSIKVRTYNDDPTLTIISQLQTA